MQTAVRNPFPEGKPQSPEGQPGASRVLVSERAAGRTLVRPVGSEGAWRLLAWLSLLLLAAGLGDVAIALYPVRFGSPDWEFATIASIFAGLPLIAMGSFGLAAAAVGAGLRWLQVTSVVLLAALGAAVLGGTVLFLLDVPIALRSVPPTILTGVKKAIAKTLLLGSMFGVSFFVAAFLTLRHARAKRV